MKGQSKNGFTLIELLVTVSILLTVIGGVILVVNPIEIQKKSRDSRRKTDLEAIRQALELYRADNGAYPASTGCSWGWVWSGCQNPWIPGLAPDFISTIPEERMRNDSFVGDSPHTFNYNYRRIGTGRYHLLTQLENENDPDINGGDYGYWSQYVYVVINP